MKYNKIVLVFTDGHRTTIEGPCEYRLDGCFFVVDGTCVTLGLNTKELKEFKCYK